MSHPSPETFSAQLNSPDVKARVLAMIEIQKDSMPAEAALPLIKQALTDRNVQVRGMAAFSLGIKPTAESLPMLVQIPAPRWQRPLGDRGSSLLLAAR